MHAKHVHLKNVNFQMHPSTKNVSANPRRVVRELIWVIMVEYMRRKTSFFTALPLPTASPRKIKSLNMYLVSKDFAKDLQIKNVKMLIKHVLMLKSKLVKKTN